MLILGAGLAQSADFLKLSKLTLPTPPAIPKLMAAPAKVCSIPLLEYRGSSKIDPMMPVKPPSENFHSKPFDRITVPNPAPACR